jgi:hypothetical protein
MTRPPEYDSHWAKAKKVCRLNMDDVRMAKALGMSPKTLMKNNPAPTQRSKLPVQDWIRELYEKRYGRVEAATQSSRAAKRPTPTEAHTPDENVPF